MEIKPNFIYPEIKDSDYTFGYQIPEKVLREDADWRNYLPPEEHQRRNGVESSSCFVQALQHSLATILEEEYNEKDTNFSERFNYIFSNGSPQGGDPLKAAQSFRDRGLIPDSLLPFSAVINSWDLFNSFYGGDRDVCEKEGKAWRAKWTPGYDVVVRREMNIQTKYDLMKKALKSSPLPFSVAQGYDNGQPKPQGLNDIHLTELVYIDQDDCPWIFDTYPPFLKKLASRYEPDFVMRLTLEPNTEKEQLGIIQSILNLIGKWIGLIKPNYIPVAIIEDVTPKEEVDKLTQFCLAIKDFEGYFPGSRSFRNNNPGNVKYSPKGYKAIYGTVKRDPQNFAIFKDYDTGFLYLKNFVKAKVAENPEQTLFQFIANIYAPASDNNSPVGYANFLAKRMGITVDYKMKTVV